MGRSTSQLVGGVLPPRRSLSRRKIDKLPAQFAPIGSRLIANTEFTDQSECEFLIAPKILPPLASVNPVRTQEAALLL